MQKNPTDILQHHWGFKSFKGSQEKIINALLRNHDVLALMPTGGGKSLCYQIPALAKDGLCIVISPLVSLIQDQVQRLKKMNLKAMALTGRIGADELIDLLDNCQFGGYKFLYLSPERLQQSLVQERLQQIQISMVAIDEAHCVSQWGHDFRPAYLKCNILKKLAPGAPMIALTATTTKEVSQDIMTALELEDPLVFKDSLLRKNIVFHVKNTEDKLYQLRQLIGIESGSSIVYAGTRRATVEIAAHLKSKGINADFFHGGLVSYEKEQKLRAWLNNDIDTMTATSAFGMGVDKADVRKVVHYHIPDSLESYFQEVGRAGRDGLLAKAVLLTNEQDRLQAKKQFAATQPDVEYIKLCYKKLNAYFQIPYSEGQGQTFSFFFNDFCHRYGLNPLLTYNAMKILDQHSVISLSNAFAQKTTVQFMAKKQELFTYIENHRALEALIKTVLRTYGGIFDYETPINTLLIAKKISRPEKEIHAQFERLQKDGILEYNSAKSDIELTFLLPREDDKTINTFGQKVTHFNNVKKGKFEDMLAYIDNTSVCRSIFLLKYFGEKMKSPCGQCDVCLNKRKQPLSELKKIKTDVFELLEQHAMTSKELTNSLHYEESLIIRVLQELLDEEKITVNEKNQYGPYR